LHNRSGSSEPEIGWSGAVSGRDRNDGAGAERGRERWEGNKNRFERGAAFLPLTLRSHSLYFYTPTYIAYYDGFSDIFNHMLLYW